MLSRNCGVSLLLVQLMAGSFVGVFGLNFRAMVPAYVHGARRYLPRRARPLWARAPVRASRCPRSVDVRFPLFFCQLFAAAVPARFHGCAVAHSVGRSRGYLLPGTRKSHGDRLPLGRLPLYKASRHSQVFSGARLTYRSGPGTGGGAGGPGVGAGLRAAALALHDARCCCRHLFR